MTEEPQKQLHTPAIMTPVAQTVISAVLALASEHLPDPIPEGAWRRYFICHYEPSLSNEGTLFEHRLHIRIDPDISAQEKQIALLALKLIEHDLLQTQLPAVIGGTALKPGPNTDPTGLKPNTDPALDARPMLGGGMLLCRPYDPVYLLVNSDDTDKAELILAFRSPEELLGLFHPNNTISAPAHHINAIVGALLKHQK